MRRPVRDRARRLTIAWASLSRKARRVNLQSPTDRAVAFLDEIACPFSRQACGFPEDGASALAGWRLCG